VHLRKNPPAKAAHAGPTARTSLAPDNDGTVAATPERGRRGSPRSARRPRSHEWISRPKRLLGFAFETILAILAAVIVAAAVGTGTGWWHFEVIESGSMTPALRVGGIAVVQAEPTSAVKVGQILALHPPGQPNIVRIHRVIQVAHRGNQVWVRTKGDANPTADPGPIRLLGSTAYVERHFIPYAGYFGVWLYKHSTRQALEVVLLVLVVGAGLVLIWGKDAQKERPMLAQSPHRRAGKAAANAAVATTAAAIASANGDRTDIVHANVAHADIAAAEIAGKAINGTADVAVGSSPAHRAASKAATATLASLRRTYSGTAPGLSAEAEPEPGPGELQARTSAGS
jgi:signal peptidase I